MYKAFDATYKKKCNKSRWPIYLHLHNSYTLENLFVRLSVWFLTFIVHCDLHVSSQVIGLTASPGVGQANTPEVAKEHILQLCSNLDADEVCTIRDQKNIEELESYRKKATESMFVFIDIQDCK
jgi:hypothetical protein